MIYYHLIIFRGNQEEHLLEIAEVLPSRFEIASISHWLTIKNNKELYLHNYNTNDSDDWPFIIISDQKKYFIAQFDKSNNTRGIWVETITFRKNDGFTVYLSTSSIGQTVYDGYCTNPF